MILGAAGADFGEFLCDLKYFFTEILGWASPDPFEGGGQPAFSRQQLILVAGGWTSPGER